MMSDAFLGEIQIYAFNFAPRGWAFCNGQLFPIAQNQALFSLLGTNYGGDGVTTFGLPSLQGRAAVHNPNSLGVLGGTENHTLSISEIPSHTHVFNASSSAGAAAIAANNAFASSAVNLYTTLGSAISMPNLNTAGGSQPHNNMQPYLVLNFCIATQGIYPSRN
jgi:microcystin-dependent protein